MLPCLSMKRSWPCPPCSRSCPAPPWMTSWPWPPTIRSWPPLPRRWSWPWPPTIRSWPLPPWTKSWPPRPLKLVPTPRPAYAGGRRAGPAGQEQAGADLVVAVAADQHLLTFERHQEVGPAGHPMEDLSGVGRHLGATADAGAGITLQQQFGQPVLLARSLRQDCGGGRPRKDRHGQDANEDPCAVRESSGQHPSLLARTAPAHGQVQKGRPSRAADPAKLPDNPPPAKSTPSRSRHRPDVLLPGKGGPSAEPPAALLRTTSDSQPRPYEVDSQPPDTDDRSPGRVDRSPGRVYARRRAEVVSIDEHLVGPADISVSLLTRSPSSTVDARLRSRC